MRNMNRVLIGVLALAAVPAGAQEAVVLPDVPVAETAVSTLPPPVASDFIREQAEIGANVMLMQRKRAEIQEMQELINALGVDAAVTLVPGADKYANSNIAIRARIEEMQQINDLTQQILDGKTMIAEFNGEIAPTIDMSANGSGPATIGNPRDMMSGPVDMGNRQPITREELDSRLAEITAAQEKRRSEERAVETAPVVTEIYGPEGDLTAMVTTGSVVTRLQVGDNFQSGQVVSILEDQVKIRSTNGSGETVIPLR